MSQKFTFLALIALGACAHGRAPSLAPAPAHTAQPTSSAAHAAADPDPAPAPQGAPAAAAPAATTTALAGDSAASATRADTGADSVSTSEVSSRAAEVFGGPPPAAAAVDSAAADSAAAAPTWDMEVQSYENVDRVQHFVRLFSGPAKEHVEERLSVGSRYEPMIREKMREGGLPEDMYYLGLVESGFNPNAYSKAAAVGMWQFMTSTARDMGMRVDWWVDERRDPVRSTTAAVRFIRGLKEQFGSLYLAAAAYDGGPGRIARGLSRYADDLEGTSGEDLFFALADKNYLKSETKDYVPQLIAAALIGKDPQRYGMVIRTEPPFAYDSIRVGPATPLAAIARASGATVAQIKELNPQILRGMTPPRDSFRVRIPPGSGARFDSALAALPRQDLVAYKVVETKRAEWLDNLAHRLGLRVDQLLAFNPHLDRSRKTGRVFGGQSILVPTPEVAAAADHVPDPSIERYPGSYANSIHHVKSGETLGGIALHYHTTVKSLMALNGLRRPMIFAGQELVVHGHAVRRSSHHHVVVQAGKRRPAHASKAARKSAHHVGSKRPASGSSDAE